MALLKRDFSDDPEMEERMIQPGTTPWADINIEKPLVMTAKLIAKNPAGEEDEEDTAIDYYQLESLAMISKMAVGLASTARKVEVSESVGQIADAIDKMLSDLRAKMAAPGWEKTAGGKPKGIGWLNVGQKTLDWIRAGMPYKPSVNPKNIFVFGNAKLPYWCFSTLPGITCPGAGACLSDKSLADQKWLGKAGSRGWCYSFKAWRQPGPFFRQLRNTICIRLQGKPHIIADLDRITKMNKKKFGTDKFVVRLYVDGDMDSRETIAFWMDELRKRPNITAYGYSKSWQYFLQYDKDINGDWPDNYVLNLSSGSIFEGDPKILEKMMKLKCVRNEFRAVKIDGDIPQNIIDPDLLTPSQKAVFEAGKIPMNLTEYAFRRNPEYTKAVQRAAEKWLAERGRNPRRKFVCPGKCGNCLGVGSKLNEGSGRAKLIRVDYKKTIDKKTGKEVVKEIPVIDAGDKTYHACGLKKVGVPIFIATH